MNCLCASLTQPSYGYSPAEVKRKKRLVHCLKNIVWKIFHCVCFAIHCRVVREFDTVSAVRNTDLFVWFALRGENDDQGWGRLCCDEAKLNELNEAKTREGGNF